MLCYYPLLTYSILALTFVLPPMGKILALGILEDPCSYLKMEGILLSYEIIIDINHLFYFIKYPQSNPTWRCQLR